MSRRAIVFLLDSSGSMEEKLGEKRKFDEACESILRLLSDGEHFSGENLTSVMLFHATKSGDVPKIDIAVPLTRVDDLKDRLSIIERKLRKVKPMGGTPIGFALSQAIEALSRIDAEDKRILLLTDGENNVGPSPEDAALDAASKGIRVDVIGIGDEVNVIELEGISERTGGIFKHYPSDGSLLEIMKQIIGRSGVKAVKLEINEKSELLSLLADLNSVRRELDELTERLNQGDLSLEEYSQKASELEFRKRELAAMIRDIRSELSRKLISAQIRLSELSSEDLEAKEIERYIAEIKSILERSELE